MSPLTHNPDFALMIAHRTIDDRIHGAQQRAQARAARATLRTARRQSRRSAATPARHAHSPLAAFRFLRPAR